MSGCGISGNEGRLHSIREVGVDCGFFNTNVRNKANIYSSKIDYPKPMHSPTRCDGVVC